MLVRKSSKDKASTLTERIEKTGVGVEGGADVEHQSGGFGTTGEGKPEDDDELIPYSINSEEGMKRKTKLDKASYEYVSPLGQSYTDESNPRDDSFYLPAKLGDESGDRSKDADEKQKKAKQKVKEDFGKLDENVADDGRARVRQQYDTGALQNSQIGGQGGSMGKAKIAKGIKKPVKTREADKNFKPKDEYFVGFKGDKKKDEVEKADYLGRATNNVGNMARGVAGIVTGKPGSVPAKAYVPPKKTGPAVASSNPQIPPVDNKPAQTQQQQPQVNSTINGQKQEAPQMQASAGNTQADMSFNADVEKAWEDYKKKPKSDTEMKLENEENVEAEVDHEIEMAPNLKDNRKT